MLRGSSGRLEIFQSGIILFQRIFFFRQSYDNLFMEKNFRTYDGEWWENR